MAATEVVTMNSSSDTRQICMHHVPMLSRRGVLELIRTILMPPLNKLKKNEGNFVVTIVVYF